jgi:hypothetical protein
MINIIIMIKFIKMSSHIMKNKILMIFINKISSMKIIICIIIIINRTMKFKINKKYQIFYNVRKYMLINKSSINKIK